MVSVAMEPVSATRDGLEIDARAHQYGGRSGNIHPRRRHLCSL